MEKKSENNEKEPTLKRIPHKIFSSVAAGAPLTYESKRLAVGQAGALAPHCFINSRIAVTILVAGSLRRLNNFCYYFGKCLKFFWYLFLCFSCYLGSKSNVFDCFGGKAAACLCIFWFLFFALMQKTRLLPTRRREQTHKENRKQREPKLKEFPLKSSALALQKGSAGPC